jgi:Zn-dependent protease with chaperone function
MTHRGFALGAGIAMLVATGCATTSQGTGPQTPQPSKTEKVSGYAEWREGTALIVDGQRVVMGATATLRGKVSGFDQIPLGYEVEAKGTRLPDGTFEAFDVEAKQNGQGLFESDVRQATDQMEAKWLRKGSVYEEDADGKEKVIGDLVSRGEAVDRVQRIVRKVTPPYIDPSGLRVHVVDTKDWNAMAMGNGSMWIFTGLLKDMDDDEVAIVIGHELAHYTHEHSRREFKRAMWGQLIALGVIGAVEVASDDEHKKTAVAIAALVTAFTMGNKYSRTLEDQADRVGLRYAYEGGYDVRKGPALWLRFQGKYGEQNGMMNFFLGEHSTSSARVRNLEREIANNYRGGAARR